MKPTCDSEEADFQGICYDGCPEPPRWAWTAVLSTPDGKLVATFKGPLELFNRSGLKTFALALATARRAEPN